MQLGGGVVTIPEILDNVLELTARLVSTLLASYYLLNALSVTTKYQILTKCTV